MKPLVLSALALVACAPSFHPTKYPNIHGSEATIGGLPCSMKHEAAAADVAQRTVAELQRRKLLASSPNIAVCAIDQRAPIACGGIAVYGCALPFKNALLTVAAVGTEDAKGRTYNWLQVMAGEVVKILADTGRLTFAPGTCAKETCPSCRVKDGRCYMPEGIGAQFGIVDVPWYPEVLKAVVP